MQAGDGRAHPLILEDSPSQARGLYHLYLLQFPDFLFFPHHTVFLIVCCIVNEIRGCFGFLELGFFGSSICS